MNDARQKRQIAERRLLHLFERTSDGLASARVSDLRLTAAMNPAFCEMFGLPASTIDITQSREMHESLCLDQLVTESEREDLRALFVQAAAGTRPQKRRFRFPVGPAELIGELTIFFPLHSEIAIFAIRDVTIEMRALEELRISQERLATTASLTSMAKLVAGICHELNTPIGAMRAAADVLDRTLPSESRALARVIVEATGRVSEITKSLARFSNLDGAPIARVDVCASLDDVLRVLQPLPPGVIITTDYGAHPTVTANARELNQVWLELISNAIKATRTGTVTVRTALEEDAFTVRVEDEGPGIAPEIAGDVFSARFTEKAGRVGMGLGLPMVARVVTACGGTVLAAPLQGRGSVFEVRMPRS